MRKQVFFIQRHPPTSAARRPLRSIGFAVVVIAFVAVSWRAGGHQAPPDPAAASKPQAREASASPATSETDPQKLFEDTCSLCHGLDFATSQRMTRAEWDWIVTEMVEERGATWITPDQQRIIIEYLTKNYGS